MVNVLFSLTVIVASIYILYLIFHLAFVLLVVELTGITANFWVIPNKWAITIRPRR